jgi:hypothetical protein
MLAVVLLLTSGCFDNDPSPAKMAADYRLSKVLNFSSSTAAEPYGFMTLTYNRNGAVIKEEMFDYPSTLISYREYEYDAGHKIKQSHYGGKVGSLALQGYNVYTYSADNLTKEESYQADGTLNYETHYEYDGNKLTTTYQIGPGNFGVNHQYKYTYDVTGRLSLEEYFGYDEVLEYSKNYFYDDEDRMIRTEMNGFNGERAWVMENRYYDDDELPDEEFTYDANGNVIAHRRIEYDAWGHDTTVIVDDNGVEHRLTSRKYDGQLLIESINYNPYFGFSEWGVTRYEYERI